MRIKILWCSFKGKHDINVRSVFEILGKFNSLDQIRAQCLRLFIYFFWGWLQCAICDLFRFSQIVYKLKGVAPSNTDPLPKNNDYKTFIYNNEMHDRQGSTKFVLMGRTNWNFTDKCWWKSRYKSKNPAKNDQEECLTKTQTDRQKNLSVTDTNYLWQTQGDCDKNRLSWKDTDCLWRTNNVCDCECPWHFFSDEHRFSVTDNNCLWQTQTDLDRHTLSVTDTGFLWQTPTVCDGHRLLVTDRDCLWQTETTYHRHRLSVTDTDCLLQMLVVGAEAHHFTADILNITKCFSI